MTCLDDLCLVPFWEHALAMVVVGVPLVIMGALMVGFWISILIVDPLTRLWRRTHGE